MARTFLSPLAQRLLPGLLVGLLGCAPLLAQAQQQAGGVEGAGAQASSGATSGAGSEVEVEVITYRGIETRMLDDGLVSFRVALKGASSDAAIVAYADCAAAQYALIRGQDFVRHIQTQLGKKRGTWRAEAVYLIARGTPRGVKPIIARSMVADCAAKGIPTV